MKFPIYRWVDGTEAFFELRNDFFNYLVVKTHSWYIDPPGPTLILQGAGPTHAFPDNFERKLVGLFLDLGIAHPIDHLPGLSLGPAGDLSVVNYPHWIDDEEWRLRYDSFAERVHQEASWMFLETKVHTGRRDVVRMKAGSPQQRVRTFFLQYGNGYVQGGDTVEQIVDRFTSATLILPHSAQEEWEATHIEWGTFVNPTPEEVEIYRLLGSPLPLLWPAENLIVWAKERFAEGT